jgi:hypothetical protein
MLGLPAEDPAGAARFLVEQGFDSLVVGADATAESVRPAVDAGLSVWVYRAAFSVRGLAEHDARPLLARDVDDVPRTWFGSGCPNRRALRDAHLAAVERLARSGVFAGFMLDGIRFASPNAGDAYFSCFCDVCRARAGALGFDFERMRRDVAALRDWCRAGGEGPLAPAADALPRALGRWPGAADWLRFRAACVVEHVREVRQVIDASPAPQSAETGRSSTTPASGAPRAPEDASGSVSGDVPGPAAGNAPFRLGAYLFTPAFAPLVGQRYGDLAPHLDVVSPMIYRTNTTGDSGLVPEWAALAGLRLLPPHGEFSAADVGVQVARARALLPTGSAALVPILRLPDDLVAATTRAARTAGADGLDYFIFRAGDEPHVRHAASAATG